MPEEGFVSYFVKALEEEASEDFDNTIEQFMECGRVYRETKQAEQRTILRSERIDEKQQLEATIEELRRATALQKVYHAFDFDGGGQVGEAALLEIGRARRRLGQREGEWSEETNSALLSLIGTDEQGTCTLLV